VRPHTLSGAGAAVWILDEFELMLLVGVEEAVEGSRRQADGFDQERGEESADVGQAAYVLLNSWAEAREMCSGRPLVGREEVMVQRRGGRGDGMRRREIDLLAPVCGAGCGFVAELWFLVNEPQSMNVS